MILTSFVAGALDTHKASSASAKPMKEIQLTRGCVAIIDDDDFINVSKKKWHITYDGYASSWSEKGGKNIPLHRFILSDINGHIDHINGNKLDNRKENLRPCTRSQNLHNYGLNKNNSSGFKGIWQDRRNNRYGSWYAKIMVNRQIIRLGCFSDKRMAAQAYNNAAQKYFGNFAYLNVL